ncbi:hypothetical protein F4775DRAFT_571195 [Biscogniauxia sp. FL1348]|nr:hypothetical protein F4775DRAFT_571195 [Biscogniauxia sp. FL1348]
MATDPGVREARGGRPVHDAAVGGWSGACRRYLESTPLYAKSGFTAVEKFALEYVLREGSRGETEVYEEISFVYEPASLREC